MKNLDMFGTFLERSNTTATAKRGAAPRDSDPLVACLRALATSGAMTPARLLVRAELPMATFLSALQEGYDRELIEAPAEGELFGDVDLHITADGKDYLIRQLSNGALR